MHLGKIQNVVKNSKGIFPNNIKKTIKEIFQASMRNSHQQNGTSSNTKHQKNGAPDGDKQDNDEGTKALIARTKVTLVNSSTHIIEDPENYK